MTFFHFVNCVALAGVPYFLVYKQSGISDYSAFWKCVQAAGAYILVQLVKMLVLATFFPAADPLDGGRVDLVGEFLKSSVDCVDLVGLHLIMSRLVAGRGHLKFVVAGLGWAAAELVVTRLLPLWVGARGVEFDWKYVRLSFESNVNLLQHIATAVLVWLHSRNDVGPTLAPLIAVMLLTATYRPFIFSVLESVAGIETWLLLFVKTVFTGTIALVAFQLYTGLSSGGWQYSSRELSHQPNNYH